MVRGGPGIGKSWLLDQVVGTDATVLRASGHPAEADLPFAGLHQLLLPVAERIAALPDPQRRAVEQALAREPMGSGHRFAAAAGLHGVLTSLAEDGPVLVVVDDAHWLDASTMTCLVFAVRRLDRDPVTVLLATRDATSPQGLGGDEIVLAPVDVATARLIARDAHPDLAPAVADEIVRVAGGWPVVLREAPADLTAEQRRGEAPLPPVLPIGSTASWSYRQRLDAIGADGRLALLTTSLERLEPARLASAWAVLGVDAGALDVAAAHGLVDRRGAYVEPSHATVGAAVQALATPAMLAAARRAVAIALADRPHRQVWFLDAALEGPDEAVARQWDAAADDAQRRAAWAEAATASEHAARRSLDPGARRRRLQAAVEHHARAGAPLPVLALLDELLADATDPDERVHLEARRLTVRLWAQPHRVDQEAARRVLEREAGAGPRARAALLSSVAIALLVWGDHAAALAAADEARSALGDEEPSTADLLVREIVEVTGARPGAGRLLRGRWVDDLRDDEIVDPALPVFLAAFVLVLIGDTAAARHVARRLGDVAASVGDTSQLAVATALHAAVDERGGDMLAARANYATATQLCLDTELTAPVPYLQLRHAHLLAALGHDEPCRTVVAAGLAGAQGSPVARHLAACAIGLLELTLGDCASAARELQAAEAMLAVLAVGEPAYTTEIGDLVEALWRLRRAEEAGPALDRLAVRAQRCQRDSALAIVWRGRGLLGDPGEIDRSFECAVHHHALAPDHFQHARTLLSWGMCLRRARRKHDARAPLRDALDAFASMGAAPWAAQASAELAACGERRRTAWAAVDELTSRELEVAVVVADGATNPAAAAALCISVRTVEDHLTRVYRKLGISGRDALPAALARPGRTGQPAASST